MEKTIKIERKNLIFRDQAQNLLNKKKEKICFDFSKVDFISRSFADELLEIMEKKKNIKIININSDIKKLLSVVKKSRKDILK